MAVVRMRLHRPVSPLIAGFLTSLYRRMRAECTPPVLEFSRMEACTYFNAVAASLLLGLLSSGACGGSAPAASAPPPASTEPATASTSPVPSPVPPEPVPAAATSSAPAAAPAASGSKASEGPDRSLDDIRAIVTNNRDTFRACYDKAAKARPGIKGTFTLKFVVNPDGTVKSAEADSSKSDIHAPELDTCAAAAFKALKFPPSKRGMESSGHYPFNFNPKGASAQ
jgi:TonB family protein